MYQKISQKQDYFREAKRLLSERKIPEAIQFLIKHIQQNQQQNQTFYGLGCIQDQEGYYQNRVIEWIIQNCLQDQSISSYDYLSLCWSITQQVEVASVWYKKMIQLNPNSYQLYFGVSNLNFNNGRRQLALLGYEKVIQLKPDFDKSYQLIAFIKYFFEFNDQQKAIEYNRIALKINPNNMYSLLLSILFEQNLQGQIDKLKQLFKMFPYYHRIQNNIGKIYLNLKQYQKAIQYLQNCLQKDKLYKIPYINLSIIHKQMGQYEKAIQILERFSEIGINKEYCWIQISKIYYLHCQQFDTAVQYLNKVLEKQSFKLFACYQLARLYNKRRWYEDSLKWFGQCVKINPNNGIYYNGLGVAHENMHNFEKAIECYLKCLQIIPNFFIALINIAEAYFSLHQWEKSAYYYQKAINIGENSLTIKTYCNIYLIYMIKKQFRNAINILTEGSKRYPGAMILICNLGDLYFILKCYKQAELYFSKARDIYQSNPVKYDKQEKQAVNSLFNYFGIGIGWKQNILKGHLPSKDKADIHSMKSLFQQKLSHLYNLIEEDLY